MAPDTSFRQRIRRLSLSSQILVGLAAGVLLGIFLGELVAPIHIVADGYILLLQMTVLPYITISLVAGLGSLTPHQARVVFSRVGFLILVLWALSLCLVFAIPLAFPDWESASFFSTSLIEPRQSFDFLNLYIPANPFSALANNVVPAVVLFSVVLGIALIRIENKENLIAFLSILGNALSKISRGVVALTPIGLFAIGANLTGTLRVEELERVQVYLLVFTAMSVLLCLWVLPGLVSAFTPVGYREVLKLTRDALITAFMTGNLFVVLPILSEASRKVLESHSSENKDLLGMPDVIVPASFNFPHSGKVLSISFILFAAWFADVSLSIRDHAKLAILGLLSYFGSLSAAVPYLLDVFRIPIDTFQLFLATGLVNSRFGSAAAAMHTFVLAVLGSCAISGLLIIHPRKILRYILITLVLLAMTLGGLRFCFVNVIEHKYTKADVVRGMELTRKQVPAVVNRSFTPNQEMADSSPMNRIQRRGKLRIAYLSDSLPYAYFNSRGKLVGLDVDMAHQLAADMGVSLEFIHLDRTKIKEQFTESGCDILMSGLAVTTDRAREMLLSTSYLDEHMAFITPDHRRGDFLTRDSIHAHSGMRIGVPNVPYYIAKLREYAPDARLVTLQTLSKPFENSLDGLDAIVMTAERGSAWSLLYPRYSVVVPQPDVLTIPVAYAVGRNDQELLSFLNTWLELKKKDDTIRQLYDYWILGKNAERTVPRWSVVRNVLHWIE
jgi:Na+/H+-dicarboxylate symporter